MTVHRACSEVTMPALEMEMLCCSMASWILVLSASFICRTERRLSTFFFFSSSRWRERSAAATPTHLVELVDETDAAVGQHQRPGLQCPLAADWVSLDVGGETDGGGPLARGGHSTTRHLLHVPADKPAVRGRLFSPGYTSDARCRCVLEELRLGGSRVSTKQHVDVATHLVFTT